ncbi:hypothetical protein DL771_005933 [Monosporascus sp. 5C6A]|nr:hypothetical protein DL771_005933 [Monosporascus sp. 5C6A]
MDAAAEALEAAYVLYARAEGEQNAGKQGRPPVYKVIGIVLAVTSGCFIGVSFVLKKAGLLKANEKYNEVAGEGYGYLKNFHWWAGMTLMILGEICNSAAYAFTDAILVTSLGALSVVITTILSAIFLKERLSMVGKISCFLCVLGSIIIVVNAPEESAVATIQEMQNYVVTPGFLTYAGVVIVGCVFIALWVAPRYGKRNMFPYISVCSWIGGLSVVAIQGLGAAIVAQAGGTPQFNHWFLYVVLVFVVITLLTEIIYLNKALNLFNAAMVTPTYYVYFTSTTIITSSVLFQGFRGTPTQIFTVVMGFLTICAGVVLLQLSKSAKDVPDTAVFTGDLDQIQMIAEQEQPETEPKADAIRGTAAIVRRISVARQKMEEEEFRRLHEEKERERLAPLSENGQVEYEWDGLRRRKTTLGSHRSRAMTTPSPYPPAHPHVHPPLGMSRFPDEEELADERDNTTSPGLLSSIAGTIRSRARTVLLPGHPDFRQEETGDRKPQSPPLPVQLSEIAVPPQKYRRDRSYSRSREHVFGLPAGLGKTEYTGESIRSGGGNARHAQIGDEPPKSSGSGAASLAPPTPPPHGGNGSSTRRQFSFQNVFRRHQADGAQDQGHHHDLHQETFLHPPRHGLRSRGYSDRRIPRDSVSEEERLGLVKGDSQSMPTLPHYDGNYKEDSDDEDGVDSGGEYYPEEKFATGDRLGRDLTDSPPTRSSEKDYEAEDYGSTYRGWGDGPPRSRSPPRPPPGKSGRYM